MSEDNLPENVIFAEPQEPSVQYWRDWRDDEVKGYFCRQTNGEFVAYLNWAATAHLQWSLFNLASYPFGSDIHVPYTGFGRPSTGYEAGEQIGYNEIYLLSDDKRAQRDEKTRFLYAPWRSPYNPDNARLNVYVSRAEAYEAFIAVFGLRKARTARLFDLIQLYYVEDAITPEDLQEQEANWPTDQDIVPFLMTALESPYFRTCQSAAELLRKYPSPQAIGPLIGRLATDDESDVRSEAAETLGFLRAAEAIPTLLAAADSVDSYLRATVAESLGAIGKRSSEVADVLLRLLGDEEATVRCFAAEALGDLQETSARDALLSRVNDTAKVRVWACYALVRLGEPLRWKVLLGVLTDRWDHSARLQAIIVLRWLADNEAIAPRILSTLQEALSNETQPKILERLEEYVSDLANQAA